VKPQASAASRPPHPHCGFKATLPTPASRWPSSFTRPARIRRQGQAPSRPLGRASLRLTGKGSWSCARPRVCGALPLDRAHVTRGPGARPKPAAPRPRLCARAPQALRPSCRRRHPDRQVSLQRAARAGARGARGALCRRVGGRPRASPPPASGPRRGEPAGLPASCRRGPGPGPCALPRLPRERGPGGCHVQGLSPGEAGHPAQPAVFPPCEQADSPGWTG
jgi:hypothetical protein